MFKFLCLVAQDRIRCGPSPLGAYNFVEVMPTNKKNAIIKS